MCKKLSGVFSAHRTLNARRIQTGQQAPPLGALDCGLFASAPI